MHQLDDEYTDLLLDLARAMAQMRTCTEVYYLNDWVTKVQDQYDTKEHRNAYFKLMIEMVKKEKIGWPFTEAPQEGQLLNFEEVAEDLKDCRLPENDESLSRTSNLTIPNIQCIRPIEARAYVSEEILCDETLFMQGIDELTREIANCSILEQFLRNLTQISHRANDPMAAGSVSLPEDNESFRHIIASSFEDKQKKISNMLTEMGERVQSSPIYFSERTVNRIKKLLNSVRWIIPGFAQGSLLPRFDCLDFILNRNYSNNNGNVIIAYKTCTDPLLQERREYHRFSPYLPYNRRKNKSRGEEPINDSGNSPNTPYISSPSDMSITESHDYHKIYQDLVQFDSHPNYLSNTAESGDSPQRTPGHLKQNKRPQCEKGTFNHIEVGNQCVRDFQCNKPTKKYVRDNKPFFPTSSCTNDEYIDTADFRELVGYSALASQTLDEAGASNTSDRSEYSQALDTVKEYGTEKTEEKSKKTSCEKQIEVIGTKVNSRPMLVDLLKKKELKLREENNCVINDSNITPCNTIEFIHNIRKPFQSQSQCYLLSLNTLKNSRKVGCPTVKYSNGKLLLTYEAKKSVPYPNIFGPITAQDTEYDVPNILSFKRLSNNVSTGHVDAQRLINMLYSQEGLMSNDMALSSCLLMADLTSPCFRLKEICGISNKSSQTSKPSKALCYKCKSLITENNLDFNEEPIDYIQTFHDNSEDSLAFLVGNQMNVKGNKKQLKRKFKFTGKMKKSDVAKIKNQFRFSCLVEKYLTDRAKFMKDSEQNLLHDFSDVALDLEEKNIKATCLTGENIFGENQQPIPATTIIGDGQQNVEYEHHTARHPTFDAGEHSDKICEEKQKKVVIAVSPLSILNAANSLVNEVLNTDFTYEVIIPEKPTFYELNMLKSYIRRTYRSLSLSSQFDSLMSSGIYMTGWALNDLNLMKAKAKEMIAEREERRKELPTLRENLEKLIEILLKPDGNGGKVFDNIFDFDGLYGLSQKSDGGLAITERNISCLIRHLGYVTSMIFMGDIAERKINRKSYQKQIKFLRKEGIEVETEFKCLRKHIKRLIGVLISGQKYIEPE